MISPQGVALATLMILGVVHGNLFDDMKAKFGSASKGFGSSSFGFGGFGGNSGAKSSFGGSFDMPKLDESKASVVHKKSNHKGSHRRSGSSSNTHTMTMVGADGKNISTNDSSKSGYDNSTKVDEGSETQMIRKADGSVINQGTSHNKSSDDSNAYALEKSDKSYADKNGTVMNSSVNKVNNQSRSAALDEANDFYDQKNADGTFVRNNTGHKNTDEHLSHNVLDENASSMVGADGTSHNVTNRKGSVGDSHRSDQNAHSDFESLDAQGNRKTENTSKKASSDKGHSSDFESNLESLKNADGTSLSKSSGSHNDTDYDKAMNEETMSKKLVNADGTSSLEASHAGGNSSKVKSSAGKYDEMEARGLNGTFSKTSSNKTDDYALDEANQSAGSINEQIGKNGVRSLNESSIESGRKAESRNNTAIDLSDSLDANGTRASVHTKSSGGTSLDENRNKTHALQASVDEHGNVKNHTVDGSYKNKKTGAYGNFDSSASIKNADGTESVATFKNDTNRNTYEAEKAAEELNSERNADGTFKDEHKGSKSRVNRTDGGSHAAAAAYSKGLGGVMSNETINMSEAYNTSDAESEQFNHLNMKGANGSVIAHNKDSKQLAKSMNGKKSMESSKDAVDAHGNKIQEKHNDEAENHDAASASFDTDTKRVQNADGSHSESNDSSNQTASEHNDSAKKSDAVHIQNADGTFSDVVSDSASKNAKKDATDVRRNEFAHQRADGSKSHDVKDSLVESHSEDKDAHSNSKIHSKNADGTELNDEAHTNTSLSHLTENQQSDVRKSLEMADGTKVLNHDSSHVNHEKARSDESGSHKKNIKNKDGSSVNTDTGFNNHADLETRGEGAEKHRYQKLGNGKESSFDADYSKTMAKGGDKSVSHDNSRTDDGKGHFTEDKKNGESHHVIDDKDVQNHSNAIIM